MDLSNLHDSIVRIAAVFVLTQTSFYATSSDTQDLLKGLTVVEAAADVDIESPQPDVVTFRIESVFAGDDSLVGREFSYSKRDLGPLPSKGEISIWTVSTENSSVKVARRTRVMSALIPKLPARRGIASRYPQIREWAGSLRRLYEASEADRDSVLLDLIHSSTAEVAAEAVHFVRVYRSDDAVQRLRQLLTEQALPIGAQIAIDESLCLLDEGVWPNSDARRDLIHAWLAMHGAENTDLIDLRISKAAETNHLSRSLAIDAYQSMSNRNADPSLADRIQALKPLGWSLAQPSPDDWAFAFYIELLLSDSTPAFKSFLATSAADIAQATKDPEIKSKRISQLDDAANRLATESYADLAQSMRRKLQSNR